MTTPAMPTEIRIGAVTYTIIMDAAKVKEASGKGHWYAFSDHKKLIIGLNPNHAPDRLRVDLLHEVMHCVLRASGAHPGTYADIVYEAHDRHGGFSVEEYTVSAMSGPLLATLRDNPDVVAYLLT